MSRVCLITGANKGIGYEAVKQISEKFNENDIVYLGARNEARGKDAVKRLHDQGLKNTRYIQIDVTDINSIKKAKNYIKKEHFNLDILVNNAGVLYSLDTPEKAKETHDVNYFGVLNVTKEMVSLMNNGSRIIHVGSFLGNLSQLSKELQDKVSSPTLKIEELSTLVTDYLRKVDENKHEDAGYSNAAYSMSKLFVMAMTKIHARDFKRQGISVVCMCPGYCKTDLAGYEKPQRTASQGAETITWLTTKDLSDDSGKYFTDMAEGTW